MATPTQAPENNCKKCHGTGALRRVFYGNDPRCPECNDHGQWEAARDAWMEQAAAHWNSDTAKAERRAARIARRTAR